MTAIEEMTAMKIFCSDKTGTLILNKLSVDKNQKDLSRHKNINRKHKNRN